MPLDAHKPSWEPHSIRVHLLRSLPFVDCDGEGISDIHTKPYRSFVCRDKAALLTSLVSALHDYFDQEQLLTAFDSPQALQNMRRGIRSLRLFLYGFKDLRHARTLSEDVRAHARHLRIASLHTALVNIERLVTACTPDDHAKIMQLLLRPSPQFWLEQALWVGFESFGPPVKRGAFSMVARHYATAAILRHFAIETRDIDTIVARLKKTRQRLQRLQSPP
jgi:hypothetical protein